MPGARQADGAEVTRNRVPETMEEAVFKTAGGKTDQATEGALSHELAEYDAMLTGTPTPFRNLRDQMDAFFEQTSGLWVEGAVIDKVTSMFTSAGIGGSEEMTIVRLQDKYVAEVAAKLNG